MSTKRFSFNVKANFKAGFSKNNVIDDGLALLSPVLYTTVPTLFGLSGWTGLLVGFSVPYLLGKALNVPSMCHAAVGIAGQHIMYVKGNGTVNQVLGKPIWAFGETSNSLTPANPIVPISPIIDPATGQPMKGLADYQTITAGGQSFAAYNPAEIASQAYEPAGTTTISDYIQPQTGQSTLADSGTGWSNSRKSKSGWRV